VAEIFRRHFDAYKRMYVPGLAEDRIARDVMACRTAVLGGHLEICTSCGFQRPAYNSCRNRHCPKCQALRGARWVEERLDRILSVHYFHVVFTLPGDLHDLARRNRALVLDLLAPVGSSGSDGNSAVAGTTGSTAPLTAAGEQDDDRRTPNVAERPALPWAERLFALTGIDISVCPACQRRTMVRLPLSTDCREPPGDVRPN
jgi:hypothetical protein